MKATIDKKFIIEILNAHMLKDHDVLEVTYSQKEYPDFQKYMGDKFLKGCPVLYQDEWQCCTLLHKYHFSLGCQLPEDVQNEDIFLDEKNYGEIVRQVPLEERKEFLRYQAYGTIEVQKTTED